MDSSKRSNLHSTYRLQLNHQYTFAQLKNDLEYFKSLNISYLYFSPIQRAYSKSLHGYDIIEHNQINPEIGNEDCLNEISNWLHQNDMGIILDVVPNHMCVKGTTNRLWNNVLENGPSSPYAQFFDIYWHSDTIGLYNKLQLALLDAPFGEVLENQGLIVEFHSDTGSFFIHFQDNQFPTDPKTWESILGEIIQTLSAIEDEKDPGYLELTSIMTAIKHLPPTIEQDPEKIAERQREKETIKRRLSTCFAENPSMHSLLKKKLDELNGLKGDSASFDKLEAFINAQPYRLSFWRVANDTINYRRFFDICELAGVRTELNEVFDEIHQMVLDFVKKGLIDGIRLDHIDGLLDPEHYMYTLQEKCKHAMSTREDYYVVVEKILVGKEKLRTNWPIAGTVGYEFLNQLNGIFIKQENKAFILDTYYKFIESNLKVQEIIISSKKQILQLSMASELKVLTKYLEKIAAQNRNSRDFTLGTLQTALRDIIACFPVYRSYIRAYQEIIRDDDRLCIQKAVTLAKRQNPQLGSAVFHFIQNILLLQHPPGLNEKQLNARRDFVMRFQQLTGPVMAKGMEDTACYRYYPLTSINEVGSDLSSFGMKVSEFHESNLDRSITWPHMLLATSTHDTKRSEDVRARLNVLSEMPHEWEKAVTRWKELNAPYKIKVEEQSFPELNDEYLLYQTLIGSWPLEPMNDEELAIYRERINLYMVKAAHEAKTFSSWINPDPIYDNAFNTFLERILNKESLFFQDMATFVSKIQIAGLLNSLCQITIKFCSPGVPDIYQGQEFWDFSLVDPDNRRPVNYEKRKACLQGLQDHKLKDHLQDIKQNETKLFITLKCLQLRQGFKELFLNGDYIPLEVQGASAEQVVAFARRLGSQTVICVTGRLLLDFSSTELPYYRPKWEDSEVVLPFDCASGTNWLNSEQINIHNNRLPVSSILSAAPVAIIIVN